MPSFPLLFHSSSAQTIAWRDGTPVSVREFLADVAALAKALPAGGHVFNMCTDRYRFAVGLCAALVAGKISLLPSAHTPEAVRQLASFAPDTFCLHDAADCAVELPRFRFPLAGIAAQSCGSSSKDSSAGLADSAPLFPAAAETVVPQIDATRVMAYLFTSGSTGAPVPHGKTWGNLVQCLRTSADRLGLFGMGACTLVGTVPPQHMYGFETTVLLALIGGFAFSNRQPFYPGDVAAELAAVPQPRVLVTSPVHLRALMLSDQALPPVSLMLSATAPLTQELARTAEARIGAPLLEIYGSTESGQIATRRTAQGAAWDLYPGISLETRRSGDAQGTSGESEGEPRDGDATVWASGGHLEAPLPLGDAIELLDAGRFLLHGRKGDLINIAGKRTSLGYLNHQLNEIPGVVDGVFFMPDEPAAAIADTADTAGTSGITGAGRSEQVTRLTAFVVAPGLTPAGLQRALRERIDAAFMPRPLYFVDALPRNATGKLPRDVLTALVAQQAQQAQSTQQMQGMQQARKAPHARHAQPAAAASSASPAAGASAATSTIRFTIAPDHPALAGHFPGQPIVPGVVLLDHAISAIGTALNRSLDACRLRSAKFPGPATPGTPLDLSFGITASGAIRFTINAATRVVASGLLAGTEPAAPATPVAPATEAVCS
ncbi:AMP-binding protein [Paraburkholderia sp. GAS82]|uniref:AMP-binding protein n=1 Tax=Paraburkholderia sp. GAS82 TaxID=3035137 RepID=UPI003D23AD15